MNRYLSTITILVFFTCSAISVRAQKCAYPQGQKDVSPSVHKNTKSIINRDKKAPSLPLKAKRSAVNTAKKDFQDTETDSLNRFTIGVYSATGSSGGLSNLQLYIPAGINSGKVSFTVIPMFHYIGSETIRSMKGISLDKTPTRNTSGNIFDFALSFVFRYTLQDLTRKSMSPYFSLGTGYSYRHYNYTVSSLFTRDKINEMINSLTLNYGLGVLVRAGEFTHLEFGMDAVSYFNERAGKSFTHEAIDLSFITGIRFLM